LRISLGSGRVCTTFQDLNRLQTFRYLQLKLVQDLLLLIIEFRDAPQPDLLSFDGRQYDIDAVELRESLQDFGRGIVRIPPQVLEGYEQSVAEKRH
jgi:hypothetical protein